MNAYDLFAGAHCVRQAWRMLCKAAGDMWGIEPDLRFGFSAARRHDVSQKCVIFDTLRAERCWNFAPAKWTLAFSVLSNPSIRPYLTEDARNELL